MKYGPKFPNFMGVARENLFCFEHEHGHVHAHEPWAIFCDRITQHSALYNIPILYAIKPMPGEDPRCYK